MVALALLGVVALGLLAAFTSGLKLMQQSTNLTMATDLAREMLEDIKADGFQKTALGDFDGRAGTPIDSVTGFPTAPYPTGRRNNQEYSLRVTCSEVSPTTRLVVVRVLWGRTHHTSLSTMVHR